MSTEAATRAPMTLANTKHCPQMFYAFGAAYPDGACHDGHLDDADSDYCTKDADYLPCPYCRNAEYQAQLKDKDGGGHFTPPYGYGQVVPGDYFA